MTDYDKVRAILDAATPANEGGWWSPTGETDPDTVYGPDGDALAVVYSNLGIGGEASANARAIVVSRNLAPALLAVAEAAQHRPTRFGQPIEFPNLPHQPSGPDLLLAIAAYMDRQDDAAEARGEGVIREVQEDLRRWADDLRAALAILDAEVEKL